jgi:predicted nucleotidyltransferase
MDKVSDRLIAIINKFVEEALKENIRISQVVLFGSHAKGTNNEFSDIDIAVVSEDFDGIRLFDNLKLGKPRVKTDIDLETHPYRPEEFNNANPFVKEILSYGIRVV